VVQSVSFFEVLISRIERWIYMSHLWVVERELSIITKMQMDE